jgi:hypothetical protein
LPPRLAALEPESPKRQRRSTTSRENAAEIQRTFSDAHEATAVAKLAKTVRGASAVIEATDVAAVEGAFENAPGGARLLGFVVGFEDIEGAGGGGGDEKMRDGRGHAKHLACMPECVLEKVLEHLYGPDFVDDFSCEA